MHSSIREVVLVDNSQRFLDEQEIVLNHLCPILNITNLLRPTLAISNKLEQTTGGEGVYGNHYLQSCPSTISQAAP